MHLGGGGISYQVVVQYTVCYVTCQGWEKYKNDGEAMGINDTQYNR